MSEQVSVRHATPSDAEQIASLVGELGYPSSGAEIVSRLAQLSEFQASITFVAEMDGNVVGVATGHVFPALHISPIVAWLTTLVVGTRYQRRGIGKYLAVAIEDWAQGHGASRLSVTSGNHRDGAHAFYERLGYERSGIRLSKPLS